MKKYNLFRNIAVFVQKHRRSKTVRGIFISLASLTVFTTTIMLLIPTAGTGMAGNTRMDQRTIIRGTKSGTH